jgi:hypothetical protein
MNPYRTCQENMDALKKVLIQRTYVALANKNVEFVLKNQNASLDELAEYLCKCRRWCGHIPGRTEVIGGDYIELRFRGWANALCASGVKKELAVKCFHPALKKTMLFQQEYERQREQDILEKRQKKAANKEKMRQEKSERKQPKKTAPPSGTAGDGGAAE